MCAGLAETSRDARPVGVATNQAGAAVLALDGDDGVDCADGLGGWVDGVVMRVADIQLSFPPILIALVLLAVSGPGL